MAGTLMELPAPANVRINSLNLEQILIWDPVKEENVTYKVEYRPFYKHEYTNLCKNIRKTECNFTDPEKLHWSIILRVRTEVGNVHSPWSETREFRATRDTILGPVSFLQLVPIRAEHNSLSIDFQCPLKVIPHGWKVGYRIDYWQNGSSIKKELWRNTTDAVLKDLESSVLYCVEVTAFVYNHFKGKPSGAVCEKTPAATDFTPGGYIVILVLFVAGFSSCLGCGFVLYKYRKLLKKWMNPPYRIPVHIEEFLQDPPTDLFVAES
ncbi:hypothetical protein GDO86_002763 [Hymenochirus boettgeri]|uniref:Fibronectin type-III domain-containing protein n=1 Tax=Hymenochirus boettgeri TaxID=247094 RepID=A0A8T2K6Q7_9PIPI|nr:hypothetical protein GDO86_002763 [Hymenochirus boettgeri]